MRKFYEEQKAILKFIDENNMTANELVRVAKTLCCCRTCGFFVQHYTKDGVPVDFGHCTKGNVPRAKNPNTNSCGFWELDERCGYTVVSEKEDINV